MQSVLDKYSLKMLLFGSFFTELNHLGKINSEMT